MKRRDFFYLSGLLPFMTLSACKKYDSWDTVVKGRVIDENSQPVEGMVLNLFGTNQTGILKWEDTFHITTQTDKEGNYRFSYLIPASTDIAELDWFLPPGLDPNKYFVYVERNGQYVLLGAIPAILPKNFEKTTVFNLQIRKLY